MTEAEALKCLEPEALAKFIQMLDPSVVRWTDLGVVLGRLETLWVWWGQFGLWCVDGYVPVLPGVPI